MKRQFFMAAILTLISTFSVWGDGSVSFNAHSVYHFATTNQARHEAMHLHQYIATQEHIDHGNGTDDDGVVITNYSVRPDSNIRHRHRLGSYDGLTHDHRAQTYVVPGGDHYSYFERHDHGNGGHTHKSDSYHARNNWSRHASFRLNTHAHGVAGRPNRVYDLHIHTFANPHDHSGISSRRLAFPHNHINNGVTKQHTHIYENSSHIGSDWTEHSPSIDWNDNTEPDPPPTTGSTYTHSHTHTVTHTHTIMVDDPENEGMQKAETHTHTASLGTQMHTHYPYSSHPSAWYDHSPHINLFQYHHAHIINGREGYHSHFYNQDEPPNSNYYHPGESVDHQPTMEWFDDYTPDNMVSALQTFSSVIPPQTERQKQVPPVFSALQTFSSVIPPQTERQKQVPPVRSELQTFSSVIPPDVPDNNGNANLKVINGKRVYDHHQHDGGVPLPPDIATQSQPKRRRGTNDFGEKIKITTLRPILVISKIKVEKGYLEQIIICSNFTNYPLDNIFIQKRVGDTFRRIKRLDNKPINLRKPIWGDQTDWTDNRWDKDWKWNQACLTIQIPNDEYELLNEEISIGNFGFRVVHNQTVGDVIGWKMQEIPQDFHSGFLIRRFRKLNEIQQTPYFAVATGELKEGWCIGDENDTGCLSEILSDVYSAPSNPYKRKMATTWGELKTQ